MVKHFLLVFDRPAGNLLRMQEYVDGREALRARFDAERSYRHDPSIEVVVLSAESEAVLHRTHARYFEDIPQMVRRGLELLREAG